MKKLFMEYVGAILAAIMTVPASKLLVPDPAFGFAILVGSTIGALVGKFLHTFLGKKRITRATTVASLIAWLVLVLAFWAESPRLSWRPVGLSHAAVLAD
ncbi:hypothetical protein [Variovorax gossypii]